MMYLSQLLINVGDNPDRPRPGRLWLRNIYHVHQRLSMAFPTPEQRRDDPNFLTPFEPARFQAPRFLFRIDNSIDEESPRAIVLVQSPAEPDWEYAFQNAPMLLAAPPQVREWTMDFRAETQYRFRIRVNLSKKGRTSNDGVSLRSARSGVDAKGRPKDQGKRIALTWREDEDPNEVVPRWFSEKTKDCGLTLDECELRQLSWIQGFKRQKNANGGAWRRLRFRSALLEGRLTITDAAAFGQAWAHGIGAAKAFGFGLLTVTP